MPTINTADIASYIELGKTLFALGTDLYNTFKSLLHRSGLSDDEINAIEQAIVADAQARLNDRLKMTGSGT